MRVRQYDRNCRIDRNCGAEYMSPCASKARTVDISEANPQPEPGELVQPGLGAPASSAGQWLLIDVTNVACP